MTISAELAERYSTEVDVDWSEAIIISHSTFSTLYLCNTDEGFTALVPSVDGSSSISASFVPVPFSITLPRRDESGRQEMAIAISNILLNAQTVLTTAIEKASEPIMIRYTVYIIPEVSSGDLLPQYDPPIELTMTDINVTIETITATATRSDILNLQFPVELYRSEKYPGLNRR